jgi:hypothetical protein
LAQSLAREVAPGTRGWGKRGVVEGEREEKGEKEREERG